MTITTSHPLGHGYLVHGESPPRHGAVRHMFYGVWCDILYGPDSEGAYVLLHPNGASMRVSWSES